MKNNYMIYYYSSYKKNVKTTAELILSPNKLGNAKHFLSGYVMLIITLHEFRRILQKWMIWLSQIAISVGKVLLWQIP